MQKNLGRLIQNQTLLFQCDIQNIFKDKIWNMSSVVTVAKMMAQLSPALNIPLLVTEHNSERFGKTLPEIQEAYPKDLTIFEKAIFSMITDDVKNYLKQHSDKKSIILYGIESHVCVQQTTFDLLEMGYDVHLLTDGISSQRQGDRTVALRRLEQAGAFLTTAESAIFEILRDSKSPDFKKVLPILKADRSNQIPHL